MLISKLDQGVFLAASRIGAGTGFEHAGGTPLPISKASTPPPPPRDNPYIHPPCILC